MEYKVTLLVIEKYKKIIEYHQDNHEEPKINKARNDLLIVLSHFTKMEFLKNIQLNEIFTNKCMNEAYLKVPFDLKNPKNTEWLQGTIKQQMERLFESKFCLS